LVISARSAQKKSERNSPNTEREGCAKFRVPARSAAKRERFGSPGAAAKRLL